MSDVIISPNMSLPVPIVGLDPGPDWANNINACLGILDEHNHSAGEGVQINPDGLNINADLPLNGNNLTLVKTVNFNSQLAPLAGAPPNLGAIYVAGNELFYNDEAGNVVPITHNGSVNAGAGSITGLPNGTASVSYSGIAQTYTFQSATNTPANLDAGSITIRPIAVSPDGITISAPPSLSSNYSLTLPAALPGVTSAVNVDPSGNISFVVGGSVPSGSVIMYGGTVIPSGYLICDGASYLISSFPDLSAVLFDSGTGNYAYGAADGTHFNVPDMRGMFPRGTDSSGVNDPDFASRTATTGGNSAGNIGSLQPQSVGPHNHTGTDVNPNPGGSSNGALWAAGATASGSSGISPGTVIGTNGTQTNPVNVYLNFIIKT